MAQRKELELKGEGRPSFIFRKSDIELAKHFETLLPVRACSQTAGKPVDDFLGAMLKQGEEQVLSALEMRVDRTLASAGAGRDCIELGGFKTIPDEDLLRGIQKPLLRFLCPKLLPAEGFHGVLSHS